MTNHGHKGTPRTRLIVDEVGNVYGELTVIGRGENSKNGTARWTCKCSCGNVSDVLGYSLRRGRSTRCKSCSLNRDRRSGTGAYRKAFNAYKMRSTKAGIDFPLSLEEFTTFVSGKCHYCGEFPTDERRAFNRPSLKGTGPDDTAKMHGIDRIDSEQSYLLDNIVACCFVCNRMKSNFGVEFFLSHIKKIAMNNER